MSKLVKMLMSLLVLAVAGCSTPPPPPVMPPDHGRYWFDAKIVESGQTVVSLDDASVQKMLKANKSKIITDFHVLVTPGQTNIFDRQKPLKYPATYNEAGKPLSFTNSGIGQKMEVYLDTQVAPTAKITVKLEDRQLSQYNRYPLSTNHVMIKQPTFKIHSYKSTLSLPYDAWISGGSTNAEKRQGPLFLYRITRE